MRHYHTFRVIPIVAAVFIVLLVRPGAAQGPSTMDRSDLRIAPGSGSFVMAGGPGREGRRIRVFYHRPDSFDRTSSTVMMVIPGAGRNADDYRDAWVEASEEHGVLILAPHYPERSYPEYWSYNLAGMTTSVTFEVRTRIDTNPEQWTLDEAATRLESALTVHPHELFGHGSVGRLLRQLVLFHGAGTIADLDVRATDLEVNDDRDDWIFGDFDRIFTTVRRALDLEARTYDLFGHSAGGQILHRLALFRPGTRADRIVAANSGWYTLPVSGVAFPYGLQNTPVDDRWLARSLREKLIVFLGARDDAREARGSLRSTPEADRQGPGRRSRGRYFYEKARDASDRLGTDLGWRIHVVPGVGHDYERMSEAAARYLWGVGDGG